MFDNWFKTSDFLPLENKDYLVAYKSGGYQVVHFCNGHWNCHKYDGVINCEFEITDVEAWQPIDEYAR